MSPSRVVRQRFDIIFKQEARALVAVLPRHLGTRLPPIAEQLTTDLPRVDVHIDYMDVLFRLADGSLLHLEFQTTRRRRDIERFLLYDAELTVKYPGTTIHTVVIYGAGIDTAAGALNNGTIRYRVRNVFLGRQDGAAVLRRLRRRARSAAGLGEDDRLDLVFLPLMKHQAPMTQVLADATDLVRQLPEPVQRQTFASMVGMGFRFLTDADFDRLVERLMSTPTGLRLLEELMERVERAEQIEQRAAQLEQRKVELEQHTAELEQHTAELEQHTAELEQRVRQRYETGLEQGIVRGKREDLLLVLATRFGTVPDAARDRLGRVTSLEQVNALLRRALDPGSTIDQVMAALPE